MTWVSKLPTALLVCFAGLGTAVAGEAARCVQSPMTFDRENSLVTAGTFKVVLENPDSYDSPSVWEGPLRVLNTATGKTCTIAAAGLFDGPLAAAGGYMLMLVAHSGSNFRLVTVNLKECRNMKESGKLTGPVILRQGRILANGASVKNVPCPEIENHTAP